MTAHVVGGGLAGLAAALALARAGHAVVVHEAAPYLGGRCRALPDGTDNGTHALMGANRAALRFLDAIGARGGWVEPEPQGLPVLDLADGSARRVALSPAAWRDPARRPPGLSMAALPTLARLALTMPPDRPVAAVMAGHPALRRYLIEPLVVAALNTPAEEASSRVLGAVLRRLAGPGATRVLVAARGLGPDLIAPARAALERLHVTLRTGARLRALTLAEGRATALDFGAEAVALDADDAVVLALPPWEAARVLPGLAVPTRFAPILNLHFARLAPGTPVRFVGVLGGLCQWILARPDGVSVTVSAADAAIDDDQDMLAHRAWGEVRAAARAFDLPGAFPEAPPPFRVVKERRATPRHVAGSVVRMPPRRPLLNLALAGDWTLPTLPATIEAAIRSGERAARALPRAQGMAASRRAAPRTARGA